MSTSKRKHDELQELNALCDYKNINSLIEDVNLALKLVTKNPDIEKLKPIMIEIENIIIELKKCKRKFKNFIKKYNKSVHAKEAEEKIKVIDSAIDMFSKSIVYGQLIEEEVKFRFKSRSTTRKVKKSAVRKVKKIIARK